MTIDCYLKFKDVLKIMLHKQSFLDSKVLPKISHLVGHIAVVLPYVMTLKTKRLVDSLVYSKCLALIMPLGAASTKKKKNHRMGITRYKWRVLSFYNNQFMAQKMNACP